MLTLFCHPILLGPGAEVAVGSYMKLMSVIQSIILATHICNIESHKVNCDVVPFSYFPPTLRVPVFLFQAFIATPVFKEFK